ncbi:hypothetical protein J5N97_022237 [Dioscorea zingiberensis]|uniref:Pentatricopeptide repeat-containing protein n=1 Tax=Dioscorea zingiberensis TaxID=325984 RepID=A0A9D5HAP2_9LILI|nr:hypothetical protein J5N97_022237 [Dioscorea zingiberensis]
MSVPVCSARSLLRNRSWPKSSETFQQTPSITELIDSIANLSTLNQLSSAFSAFSLLQLHSTSSLLLRPISSLLSCSTTIKSLSHGLQLHAKAITLGFLNSHLIFPRLTSFYTSLGHLSSAHSLVVDSLDVLPWNMLISGCAKNGFFLQAVDAYRDLVQRGVEPDSFTFTSVLSVCGEVLDLELGKEVHARIMEGNAGWNLFVMNALVAMYSKCGSLDVARKLFDGMLERDVVSWNSMISGYASKGMWKEAFQVFDWMRGEGVEVNSVTWNTIAGGCLQMGEHEEALRLVSQMIWCGSGVDFVTLVIGLNACSRLGSLKLGKEIHGLAVRMCCDGMESVHNALIIMYSRCKSINYACIVFGRAKSRSLVTWNSMIAGFALADKVEEISLAFQDMVSSGVQPNYVTVVTVLSLCARVANLQHGCELHCHIIKHGYKGYRLLWNALVDMYSKSGRISVAKRVFDMMSDRDGISYTSLIAGFGMQGDGQSAVELFEDMIEYGIKPDHVSMVAILSACSHSGLVSEGEVLFNKMVNLYGIAPHMEHFSCMVDLYSRAGLLSKAEEMLNGATLPPTAAMWAALVGACQVHGNTEIGERAARKLLEMKTDNAGHYVLIANMYAAAGCWEELAKVRTLMRDLGVRKAPGCAWVDLGNGFHPFLVGDRSSPLSPEIYEVLDALCEQMRDTGNIADEMLVFDEQL